MFDADNIQDAITFDGLCNIYVEADSFSSPADLHGQLCGQLAAGQRLDRSVWLNIAVEQMNLEGDLSETAERYLVALYEWSYEQLLSPDLSFLMLLPDDNDPMSVRLEALSQWCHGFLAGYGLAGVRQESFSKESQAILLDFTRIVKVDTEIEAAELDNNAENDFMEVCEYVRMAVLTLFDESHKHYDGQTVAMPTEQRVLH